MPSEPIELNLADALLACLRQKLEDNPNPPARFCLRVGQEVRQDLSLYEDECCEGLAYVKVNQVYPSPNFPELYESNVDCGISWAVDLEMGVFRCAPMGTETAVATCEEWAAAANQVGYDSAAMRAATACFRGTLEFGQDQVVRPWLPLSSEGGCVGGTQIVTVAFFDSCA